MFRVTRWFLLAAVLAAVPVGASNYSLESLSKWDAMVEFGDEPLCALYSTAVHDTPAQEHPDMISISLVWKPSKGLVMKFNGSFSATPSLRVESVDTGDAWDVTLAAPDGGMAARRVVLDASRLDTLIRDVGLGHPMAITVTDSGKTPVRHETSRVYARIAVPMYRACVKALMTEPLQYQERPRERYGAKAEDGSCRFTLGFDLGEYPGAISLRVDDRGAEIAIWRSTVAGGPHGEFKNRKKPDRVDARLLYGETLELLEEVYYPIAPSQLEALAAELSRGASRTVTLTDPGGAQTTLSFGGPLGKPSAAMFEACRKATFSPPGR